MVVVGLTTFGEIKIYDDNEDKETKITEMLESNKRINTIEKSYQTNNCVRLCAYDRIL